MLNAKGINVQLQDNITRDNLKFLMTLFYKKAINDSVLASFFIDELGDDITSEDWIEHIELLADFWLAELLGEKTYKGNFVGAHIKLPRIKKETFSNWIELFSLSADEVYVADIANEFKKRGILLSQQFISDLKL